MIQLFRTNQFIGIILILIYATLIRSSGFFSNFSWEISSPGILSYWLHSFLNPASFSAKIFSLILVFVEAVLLNVIINNNRLTTVNTYIPAALYVLFCSFHPSFLLLSAPLLANLFIILALNELLGVYKKHHPASLLFNTGLLLSMASLFYSSYILFIPFLIFSVQILRAFKLKELLVMLSGFFVPYFLLGTYLFWFDQLEVLWSIQFVSNFSFFDLRGVREIQLIVTLGSFGILLFWIIATGNQYFLKQKIQVQKYLSIFFWFLLFSGIATLFQSNVRLDHLILLSIPFSLFLSDNFIKISNPIAETFHLLLLFGLLFLHYYYYITTGSFGLS